MLSNIKLSILFSVVFISLSVHAVSVINLPPANGNYMTIEDRDNIYVGALSTQARITGSNKFTSHPDHHGLSYLSDGIDRTIPSISIIWGLRYTIEIWEDNPPVSKPYLGVHCWWHQNSCYTSVFAPYNTEINDSGFRLSTDNRDSRLINPRISPAYMSFLSAQPVGKKFVTSINYCWTPSGAGLVSCTTNLSTPSDKNRWEKRTVTFTKDGHLRILNSLTSVDVMIASDGDFFVLPTSTDCERLTVSGKEGIACRFLDHEFTLSSSANIGMLSLTAYTKDSRLSKVSNNDLQISADKTTWHQKTTPMPFQELKKSNSIYIFMSKNAMKEIAKTPPPRRLENMFSLTVRNSYNTESGFYELTGSTDVNFINRRMGVSIREANGITNPVRSGTVGRDKLEFEYIISESATAPSESLEVSVRQDTGTPYKGHCTFYPPNNINQNMAVAIPARILFTDRIGLYKNISAQINCDGTPLDLRKFKIIEDRFPIPWTDEDGVSGAIRFYDISLLFNLRHDLVRHTIGGEAWEGEVYQSGTISVKSVWK